MFQESLLPDGDTLFVNVILPLAIAKRYTYRVPRDLNEQVGVGKRVVVQFGKSRLYTAVIAEITKKAPDLYEAKYILDVLDAEPLLLPSQLRQWAWISTYYMCNEGEVMQAAMPSALKLASETRVILLPDSAYDKALLSDKEFLVVDALEIQPELKVGDVVKVLGQRSVFKILKGLFEKGIIHISEELNQGYKPRQKSFVSLNPMYDDVDMRRALFEVLERTPKQLQVFLSYLKLSRESKWILKKDLQNVEGVSSSSLKTLLDKEIFRQEVREVSRLEDGSDEDLQSFELSDYQQQALDSVKEHFVSKDVVLLYGVTASGKTQLYVRLIEETIAAGKQVLFLLPEIALTTQIIERLRNYFGSKIGIYHSRLGDNERAEVWNKLLERGYDIILGARSSVFLPFKDLGLIVVDEEHESSYKQYDPAPRYHARDVAIALGAQHKAKVLLGSATPSLESYYNAKIEKYGLTELTRRFGESSLPDIKLVNITEETKKKTIRQNFTSVLVEGIKDRLQKKEQVIIFQNRRGYAPMHVCGTCGYVPHCLHCDVSLTYHKSSGKLHCHYCGYKQETVSICPACGSTHIEQKGFGTERLEDDLQMLFPEASVGRMDLDTTRAKNAFQSIINEFASGRIDILVGTQIVAKGLDFDNVTLIGVINADTMLNYPDFRAYEKAFQLLSQVGGRAGRREKKGEVIIQAHSLANRVLGQVISHNYEALFASEMLDRRNFHYPPLYRMIRLDVKHKDAGILHQVSEQLAKTFRESMGERVLGPEEPLIGRLRNLYIRTIYIKVEREGISITKIKEFMQGCITRFHADKENKGALIQIDVDPY